MAANEISLLHLTDLHYASGKQLVDSKIGNFQTYCETPFEILAGLLESLDHAAPFDAIAISGDITTRGETRGLHDFRAEALPVLQKLVGTKAAICLVPGNHDVAWDLDPKSTGYFEQKFRGFAELSKEACATTCLFPVESVAQSSMRKLTFHGSDPIFVDPTKRLLVMCINSAVRCGERDPEIHPAFEELKRLREVYRSNPGTQLPTDWCSSFDSVVETAGRRRLLDICQITLSQLDSLRKVLDRTREEHKDCWPDLVKVAILHHHITPFEAQQTEHKPFDIMNDAARLLNLLGDYEFDIALTGHKHTSYVQPVLLREREMLVVGGSTVGGQATEGVVPGVRQLLIDVRDRRPTVRIVDLPCNRQIDVRSEIQRVRTSGPAFPIFRSHGTSRRLWKFPIRVSATIEQSLSREVVKRDVSYEIAIQGSRKIGGGLTLSVKFSFEIENFGERLDWKIKYPFEKAGKGEILEACVDGVKQDLELLKAVSELGLQLDVELPARKKMLVSVTAEEPIDASGSVVLVNYCPTEGMTLDCRSEVSDVKFEIERIGPHHVERDPKVKNAARIRYWTEDGLMPFQGFRFIWRRQDEQSV
ncbi:MAG TPA: metallophosphoesterase [Steroidobacteraceae bacterium]|nr:metallophosphoesterase [Steroidobacteraceae bacterium]